MAQTDVATDVREAIDAFLASLNSGPIVAAVSNFASQISSGTVGEAIRNFAAQISGGTVGDAFRNLGANLDRFTAYMQPATDALAAFGRGTLEVTQTIGSVVLGGLQRFGEALLIGAASFGAVTGAAALFVQAADPATMQRFQMALQDFMASIGVALAPVIVAGQQILDQFNRVFTELRPILMPLVDSFVVIFRGIADIAQAVLVPILEALAPAFQMILQALTPLIEPLVALGGAIGSLLGMLIGGLAGALELVLPPLVTGLRWLTDTITLTVETIRIVLQRLSEWRPWNATAVFDISGAIEEARAQIQARALARELARNQVGPGTVAARPAQMVGIEQLGEQARLAAFGARSQSQLQEQGNTWLERMTALLQRLVDQGGGEGEAQPDWTQAGLQALGTALGVI